MDPQPPNPLHALPVQVHADLDRHLYWVPISTDLLPDLLTRWSEPVQLKLIDGQLVVRRHPPVVI